MDINTLFGCIVLVKISIIFATEWAKWQAFMLCKYRNLMENFVSMRFIFNSSSRFEVTDAVKRATTTLRKRQRKRENKRKGERAAHNIGNENLLETYFRLLINSLYLIPPLYLSFSVTLFHNRYRRIDLLNTFGAFAKNF